MFRNVLIKAVDKYLPPKVVDNQYYIDHFDKLGIRSAGLFKAVGRDKRYLVEDNKENTFTMGLNAAKNILKQTGLKATDFDMLVFVSDSAEFLAPTTALTIREHLGATNAHMVFDMNQNCTGMVAALDVVSSYMKTKKQINRALVISCFYGSLMAKNDDPVSNGCLSDGASATILEVAVEEEERGIIDASYLTNSTTHNLMVFPACGVSKLGDPNTPEDQKKMFYGYDEEHEADFLGKDTVNGLKILLDQNDLKPTDVDYYLVSQFEKSIIDEVSEGLEVPEERFVTTMAELGYVGNSSPIYAFEKLINTKDVKEGELAFISSVGAGYIVSSVLYKF